MKISPYIVTPGEKVSLKKRDSGDTGSYADRKAAESDLKKSVERLARYQDVLYAQDTHALLIIFQAMDAAGKDGTIKHVMSGINPQGCQVYSFKAPSAEELDHDYLWRCMKALPERGRIGIFNRSYYEEVLITRVHPEVLARQKLPKEGKPEKVICRRFEEINHFERYLERNGIHVLKFFLHVSKEEQRKRFLERLEDPAKHWKFSSSDLAEREHWNEYMKAYEDLLTHTSTEWAPWHIIPADHKWFTRVLAASIIVERLKALKLSYPSVSEEQLGRIEAARAALKEKV